jgi:hypothetical protein
MFTSPLTALSIMCPLVVDIKNEINNVELKALGKEDKDKQYND